MDRDITHNHSLPHVEVKRELIALSSKPTLFLAYVNDTPSLSVAQISTLRVIVDPSFLSSHIISAWKCLPQPRKVSHPSLPFLPLAVPG